MGNHGLEDGGRQVWLGGALIDQGLEVRLGKNPAAGGDRVERFKVFGQVIQTRGIGVHELGHLVNKRPRASGTGPIHALFHMGLEEGDLGILPTQFNNDIRVGIVGLNKGGLGNDFLDEGHVQYLSHLHAARPRDGHLELFLRKGLAQAVKYLSQSFFHV